MVSLRSQGLRRCSVTTPEEECTTKCAHEDWSLACPYCLGVVNPDTLVCGLCEEMVAPVKFCAYCGEQEHEE